MPAKQKIATPPTPPQLAEHPAVIEAAGKLAHHTHWPIERKEIAELIAAAVAKVVEPYAQPDAEQCGELREPTDIERELISRVEDRKDFSPLEDGYVYYWADGALSAWQLRAIADELDRRNAEWDAQLKSALAGGNDERT